MKAIKVVQQGSAEIQDVPTPELKEGYILVKVRCVALNPTDWKHIDKFDYIAGCTVGCDYSGTVESIGHGVSNDWKKGDRIAGIAHGCDPYDRENGVFSEYAVVKDGIQFKVPDHISDEDAATFGVGIGTIGQSLYQALDLPLPGSLVQPWHPLLIYGASTATGTLAIQMAKLSGVTVLAVCSPSNFDLVKALGAEEVFDYHDSNCASQIRAYTNDKLYNVLDCIGGESGTTICAESLSSQGGQICSIVRGTPYPREDVRVKPVMAYSIFGEPYRIGDNKVPTIPEDFEYGRLFFKLAEKLITAGKIKAHPAKVGNGLDGVMEGLDDMRQGRVSGVKLVYRI